MNHSSLIDSLLSDRTYHIEFNGHLTNHVKHAVIALERLGMSEEQITTYYKNYAYKTAYGFGLEPARTDEVLITEENWMEYLGKRLGYSSYCQFFDAQITLYGLDAVLMKYLPILINGWAGAFTHATIHLGWALDVNHRWMIIEGLSYMAFTYIPCHFDRASKKIDKQFADSAIETILRLCKIYEDNPELNQWRNEILDESFIVKSKIHPELMRSGLQSRIALTLEHAHPLIYESASWITHQIESNVWDQLYYVVTLLYLAKPGNFVILHLITSLHAMEQISKRLNDNFKIEIIKCFWIGMLCILFAEAILPNQKKLLALHRLFDKRIDLGDKEVWEEDWQQIIARAFEEDEEHNPKLVYVLRLWWQKTNMKSIYRAAAAQFTTTPLLPTSFENPPNA